MSDDVFRCSGCGVVFEPSRFVSYSMSGGMLIGCGADDLILWLCCRDCWDSKGVEFRRSVAESALSRVRSMIVPVRLTYGPNGVVESESDRARYNRQMGVVDAAVAALMAFAEGSERLSKE